jgi:hypothetical protein
MLTYRCGLLLVMTALASIAEVQAGSPMPMEIKCPVGGKRFTHIGTATMSRWGSRPDGKPYGSWTFPVPIAECPDNGLVIYREFSKDEIKTLKRVLATPEYQQMRAAETPYYRASWLMGQLNDPVENQLWFLQQASWETDLDLPRKARYQEEFVRRARSEVKPAPPQDELGWIVTQLRAVNALRELEKFDEALQLLDAVPLASLDVVVPEEKVSGTTPSGLGKKVENYGEIRAAQSRRSWLPYADSLRKVIARHDPSSEPIDMLPVRVAAGICATRQFTAPEYKQVCESDAVRQQLDRAEKMRSLNSSPPQTDGGTPR